jgi:hypothetical protein
LQLWREQIAHKSIFGHPEVDESEPVIAAERDGAEKMTRMKERVREREEKDPLPFLGLSLDLARSLSQLCPVWLICVSFSTRRQRHGIDDSNKLKRLNKALCPLTAPGLPNLLNLNSQIELTASSSCLTPCVSSSRTSVFIAPLKAEIGVPSGRWLPRLLAGLHY